MRHHDYDCIWVFAVDLIQQITNLPNGLHI